MAYAIAGALLAAASRAGWRLLVLLVALAGILEIAQAWVPGRDSALGDFLASAAGGLLGVGSLSMAVAPARVGSAWARTQAIIRYAHVGTVAVGALAVAASLLAAQGAVAWLGAGLALVMLAIAVIDGQSFIIPDWLTAPGLALGLLHAVAVVHGDVTAALMSAVPRAAALALLFLALRVGYLKLRGRHGIGLGDVKLAAVAGVWLDWPAIPVAIEIAALSALSVYAVRCYVLRRPIRPMGRLPFGVFFAPAIWVGWLLQAIMAAGLI